MNELTDEQIDALTIRQFGDMAGYPLQQQRSYARDIIMRDRAQRQAPKLQWGQPSGCDLPTPAAFGPVAHCQGDQPFFSAQQMRDYVAADRAQRQALPGQTLAQKVALDDSTDPVYWKAYAEGLAEDVDALYADRAQRQADTALADEVASRMARGLLAQHAELEAQRQAEPYVPETNFGNIALSEHALSHAINQAACAVADGQETDRIRAIGKALWRQWQAQRQAGQACHSQTPESEPQPGLSLTGATQAAPPPAQVPLTEKQIRAIDASEFWDDHTTVDFARAIEQAHGIHSPR